MPEEFVEYKVKDGNVSITLNAGNYETHARSVIAIIGELAEWGLIDEEHLFEIIKKTEAIRKQKYKGVYYSD